MTMRYQGKITTWKDDQGFGFITPDDGGERVFLHITSFTKGYIRPIGNETVSYELTTDKQNRSRAANVSFVGKPSPQSTESKTEQQPRTVQRTFTRKHLAKGTIGDWIRIGLILIFFIVIISAVLVGKMAPVVLIYYALISLGTILAYGFDKSAAKKQRRRTPEATLHFLSLIGGWPGALLAQGLFHHKTKKRWFQMVFWFTVFLNCLTLVGYSSPSTLRWLFSLIGALGS